MLQLMAPLGKFHTQQARIKGINGMQEKTERDKEERRLMRNHPDYKEVDRKLNEKAVQAAGICLFGSGYVSTCLPFCSFVYNDLPT